MYHIRFYHKKNISFIYIIFYYLKALIYLYIYYYRSN